MWTTEMDYKRSNGFSTPPAVRCYRQYSPVSERKQRTCKADLFHVVHKVPSGDSPYVRAKHVQLIDKDPSKSISLFWEAINSGDRVDSALKDMAIVMKQLNRSDEAIEAIRSFRHLCTPESQDSLENVLVELYKRSGRIKEEIDMLENKLKRIDECTAFGGRRTKIARSQGKKVQITIEQEKSRVLGNLAWAYLQLKDYKTAEQLYREALCLEPDRNKQCNLAVCLMHTDKISEARFLLHAVKASSRGGPMDESYAKSFENAYKMLNEVESQSLHKLGEAHTRTQGSFAQNINRNSCSATISSHCQNHFQDKDSAFGNSFETSPDLSRNNGAVRIELHTVERRANTERACKASPALLTQPRTPWWSSNGDWRRRVWEDSAVRNSSRKLSFDQHIETGNEARAPAPVSKRDGDWRKKAWGALATSEVFSELNLQQTATKACNADPYVPIERARIYNNSQIPSTVPVTDGHGGVVRSKDANEVEGSRGNNLEIPAPVSQKPTHRKKQSWADMAEEEEREAQLLTAQIDHPDAVDVHYQSSSMPGYQGFCDENSNSNISTQAHPSLALQAESSHQNHVPYVKDGNLGFLSDDGKQPSNVPTVRRSLCFNQQKKPESTLQMPSLCYEGDDSVQEITFGKFITPTRRNRLQVFRDITHSDS